MIEPDGAYLDGPLPDPDEMPRMYRLSMPDTRPEEDPEQAWKADALCAQTDPEVFFPEKGGSAKQAKRVCTSCEVRSQCLAYALENDERFGIWGGLSERERRKLRGPLTKSWRHGTTRGYAMGCRSGVVCPGDESGRSCAQAHREYQAKWHAHRGEAS